MKYILFLYFLFFNFISFLSLLLAFSSIEKPFFKLTTLTLIFASLYPEWKYVINQIFPREVKNETRSEA